MYVAHIDRITPVKWQARQLNAYPVGDLACFSVKFLQEYRYYLEKDFDSMLATELSVLRLSVPVTETNKDTYADLTIAGETGIGSPKDILIAVQVGIARP